MPKASQERPVRWSAEADGRVAAEADGGAAADAPRVVVMALCGVGEMPAAGSPGGRRS